VNLRSSATRRYSPEEAVFIVTAVKTEILHREPAAFCRLFYYAASVVDHIASNDGTVWWIMSWKECESNRTWTDRGTIPAFAWRV
jgi:hypothetical protein